ncbi:hypothetical protein Tco_1138491, partial [Tanacetum coccineum]
MASMKYCDKHNQTATATTLTDGTLELRANIDTLEYTFTEASVQSKLQLADVLRISMLPNNEIFEGIDQAVTQPSPSEPLPSSSPPPVISATTESEPTPIAESTTHPNSLSSEPNKEPIEHTFKQPSSEHQPLSPRHETKIPQSQDPTHPHVAEERTMIVDDLLQLVPKLITKVDSLEKELKQNKLTMRKVIVKLVKKVKKMEVVLKRRHVVLIDSEDEDAENSFKQGRNLQEEGEADISPEGLEAAETLAKVLTQRTKTYTRKVKTGLRRKLDADEVNTGEGINTGFTDVNTAFKEIKSRDDEVNTKLTMGKAIVKLVKKVKKMEVVLKRRHVVLTDSENEDVENSSKQGRNLQEECLDEMVRSIMKDKSEDFETPTQGKTSGEADISPEGLEESGDDEVNSSDESIIPSPKKGQREGKAVLEEKSQSK